MKEKEFKINFTVVGKPEEQKENYNQAIKFLVKCIKENEILRNKEVKVAAK